MGLLQFSAIAWALVFGVLASSAFFSAYRARRMKKERLLCLTPNTGWQAGGFASTGLSVAVLMYLRNYSYNKAVGKKRIRCPPFSAGSRRLSHLIKLAGYADEVTLEAALEFRTYLVMFLAVGAGFLGLVVSNRMGLLLLFVGACLGFAVLPWALKQEALMRRALMERSLSQLIEVLCLGLRSGLSFDFSLELYCSHFANQLSAALNTAAQSWRTGLMSREDALHRLAATYESDALNRVVSAIARSLRFGSSLADSLEPTAAEVRQAHRARVEEQVQKAPVKMMLPVGMLILPSMLLLVLGPILLELLEGF